MLAVVDFPAVLQLEDVAVPGGTLFDVGNGQVEVVRSENLGQVRPPSIGWERDAGDGDASILIIK